MNDFTKEELLWLYDEIYHVIEQYEYEDERAYSTRDKLKSMIDNYCEHTMEIIINENDVIVSQCPKCGKGYYKSAGSIELI